MGRTLLLQWSLPPNPARSQGTLSEYVLSRCLEHYGLAQPIRTSISIRTYRASIPTSADASTSTPAVPDPSSTSTSSIQRALSVIVYSDPIPPPSLATPAGAAGRAGQGNVQSGLGTRDDTSYVFIEDKVPTVTSTGDAGQLNGAGQGQGSGQEGATRANAGLGDEDFEIIDPPGNGNASQAAAGNSMPGAVETGQGKSATATTSNTLALRPAGSVIPLLHQIASPFVLGATKSARAAASTTAEKATASKLSGALFTLSTYTFPAMAAPYPSIVLSVHVLPGAQVGMIILEAELLDEFPGHANGLGNGHGHGHAQEKGAQAGDAADELLREFLEGCIPEVPPVLGIPQSTTRIIEAHSGRGEYADKMRDVSGALARLLRETGHI